MQDAVGTIVFAEKNGKYYALTVQRKNTKIWNRTVMFGAAGRIEKKETKRQALEREIEEELQIGRKTILRVIPMEKMPLNAPGYGEGTFYLVEVPFSVLEQTAQKIKTNPRLFQEVGNARIVRIKNLGKNKKITQPHFRAIAPSVRARLIREKKYNRKMA